MNRFSYSRRRSLGNIGNLPKINFFKRDNRFILNKLITSTIIGILFPTFFVIRTEEEGGGGGEKSSEEESPEEERESLEEE